MEKPELKLIKGGGGFKGGKRPTKKPEEISVQDNINIVISKATQDHFRGKLVLALANVLNEWYEKEIINIIELAVVKDYAAAVIDEYNRLGREKDG